MAAEIQLKLLKEHGRKEIFLSLARVPNSSRVLCGASDGNVYDLDPLAEKPEFKALGRPRQLRDRRGDCRRDAGQRRLRRQAAVAKARRRRDRPHGRERPQQVDSQAGQLARRQARRQRGRRHGLPRVGGGLGQKLHELRGHDEQTPNHFPSMLYTCAFSADGQQLATADKTGRICLWDAASGNKLRQLDAPGFYTWDPKQRIHSIGGTRAVAFSPDGKQLVAGGIGTIGNIDHLDGPSRVEVFELEGGKSEHVFSGDAKGLVEQLLFHPEGKWLARRRRRQRRPDPGLRPGREESHQERQGPDAHPRRRPQRRRHETLRRGPRQDRGVGDRLNPAQPRPLDAKAQRREDAERMGTIDSGESGSLNRFICHRLA